MELDVPGTLTWNSDIVPTTETTCSITEERDATVYLTGGLESLEPDGCATVRLGESIILLDTAGHPPAVGSFVRIQTDRLALYDIHF